MSSRNKSNTFFSRNGHIVGNRQYKTKGEVFNGGPNMSLSPNVTPAGSTEEILYTETDGLYTPSGGGVVTITEHAWLANGVVVGTGGSFTYPALTYRGQLAQYRETATETGGTSPGSRVTLISLGYLVAGSTNNLLLLEDGFSMLLEDGFKVLLEA